MGDTTGFSASHRRLNPLTGEWLRSPRCTIWQHVDHGLGFTIGQDGAVTATLSLLHQN